ncbi:methyl-accepting chemotaxis protein, partial [Herbaspirillum sp. YR522]|uniref:methyl-accepting chemotaxis protein n=1 Tax=Herbaspirillum sp. YR522 TaxID=1144342 RepID=UPI00026F76F0
MNNFKIGQRLGLGFAALLILLVAIAGFGLRQVSKLNDRIEFLTSVDEGKLLALSKTQFAVGLRAIAARNLVLVSGTNEQKGDIALVTSAQKDIDAGIAQLDTLMKGEGSSQEERQMLDQLRSLEATYLPIATRIGQLATSQQTEAAKSALVNDCMPILRQVIAHIARFNEVLRANSTANVAAADQAYELAKWTMLATSLIALLLGSAIAWMLTRSISVPLQQAVTVAQNVSAGDLSSRIVVKGRDELGQLMTALKGMNDSLQSIVGEVRHGTDTIAVASDEIKRGNMDLSARTEQQAGSLQETASAMEQLTATVKQNAENAQQANQLAASASTVAAKGGDVVHRVVNTMDSISESSRKIVDIISVIDGIAFQTNILALNAAVEAARA